MAGIHIKTDTRSVKVFDTYPGGKGGDGVYQFIINHIPAHTYYMEPFLGSGAIFLKKKPAKYSFLGDADESVYDQWRGHYLDANIWGRVFLEQCNVYKTFSQFLNYPGSSPDQFFIYLDPPYPESVRRSSRNIYGREMKSESEHMILLERITDREWRFPTMISCYKNDLYEQKLKDWHMKTFNARTRAGNATEVIWMNYDISTMKLHDYQYVGLNSKDRERIRLKTRRWVAGLEKLPGIERDAILSEIKHQFL